MGIGTALEFFQSEGKMPVEIDKLKMRVRGAAIEKAERLSIRAEMPSGPMAGLEERLRRR